MTKRSKSSEYVKEFNEGDFAGFCDGLSSWLKGYDSVLAEAVGTVDYNKVNISIKKHGDRISLEMKVKRNPDSNNTAAYNSSNSNAAHSSTHTDDRGYKQLKKAMKETYRILQNHQKIKQFPPEKTLLAFLAQSEEMVSYPDKGAPFYSTYSETCAELKAAYYSKQQTAYNAALEKINDIKKQAHHQYK